MDGWLVGWMLSWLFGWLDGWLVDTTVISMTLVGRVEGKEEM